MKQDLREQWTVDRKESCLFTRAPHSASHPTSVLTVYECIVPCLDRVSGNKCLESCAEWTPSPHHTHTLQQDTKYISRIHTIHSWATSDTADNTQVVILSNSLVRHLLRHDLAAAKFFDEGKVTTTDKTGICILLSHPQIYLYTQVGASDFKSLDTPMWTG